MRKLITNAYQKAEGEAAEQEVRLCMAPHVCATLQPPTLHSAWTGTQLLQHQQSHTAADLAQTELCMQQ